MHAGLAAAVEAVVAVPLAGLWPDELQAHVVAVAPLVQPLSGFVSLALGELARAGGGQLPTGDGGSRSLVGWVAEATRTGASAAGGAVRTAVALDGLPLVAQAVVDGTVTLECARVLAWLVDKIDPAVLVESQGALIDTAGLMDPAALAVWVRHLIATHGEPALDGAAAAASARRFCQARLEPDGVLRGRFVLPAEDAETLLTVLEPLARRQGSADERSAAPTRRC